MHTISVRHRPKLKVNIHNQCTGINLINQGCFSRGADWDEKPDEKVDASCVISADLKSFLAVFEGALIYELQGEYTKTDNQLESTYTLFLVSWKFEGYKKFCVLVQLIGCDKTSHWDNAKLERYYQRYPSQLNVYTGPIKDTWSIGDNTVLMTRLELDFTQRDGVLNIIISESVKDDLTRKPKRIDLER
jgi:hypothetical protein